MLITLESLKEYLGIDPLNTDYDVYLTNQIEYFSEIIESYCNRVFAPTDYVNKFYVPSGDILLKMFPVNSVASVTIDGVVSTEYFINAENGICKYQPTNDIPKSWGYAGVTNNVEVSYNAGYTTIPLDVQGVVKELCKGAYYNKDKDPTKNLLRENIQGIVSFVYGDPSEMPSSDHSLLLKYTSTLDKYKIWSIV